MIKRRWVRKTLGKNIFTRVLCKLLDPCRNLNPQGSDNDRGFVIIPFIMRLNGCLVWISKWTPTLKRHKTGYQTWRRVEFKPPSVWFEVWKLRILLWNIKVCPFSTCHFTLFTDTNASQYRWGFKSFWSRYHNENRIAKPFVSVSRAALFCLQTIFVRYLCAIVVKRH